MLDLNYFKYLVKSKKYLLVFVTIIFLLNAFNYHDQSDFIFSNSSLFLNFSAICVLVYALPIVMFKVIHDKKAVDSYFSIPVERKKLLWTTILFIILAIFVPFVLSTVVISLISGKAQLVSTIIYLLTHLMFISVVVIFNSYLYLLANNTFDGVVVIGAYSALPFFAYLALIIYVETHVAGNCNELFENILYLSPIANYCNVTMLDISILNGLNVNKISIIADIVFGVVFACLLDKIFINRKVERAESISDNFLSYPLLINFYTVLVLFSIATDFNGIESITDFISSDFIFLIIVFVLYVVSHFVYRRKFYLDVKMIVTFLLILFLSLGFNYASTKTRGFGLGNRFVVNKDNAVYSMWMNFYNRETEVEEWFYSVTDEEKEYLSIDLEVDASKKVPNEDTIAIFEKYRELGVKQFYNSNDISISEYATNSYGCLNISSHVKGGFGDKNMRYSYYLENFEISLDDLKILADDEAVSIYISIYYNEYVLEKNMALSKRDVSYDKVYEMEENNEYAE